MKISHQHQNLPAFTLMEVIVVIGIILALATMTIGGLGYAKKKANISKTTVLHQSIDRALVEYKSDALAYPQGDGDKKSSELVYMALYGDGVGSDGVVGTDDDTSPDDEPDEGATTYLNTLDPTLKGKARNVTDQHIIIDAWENEFYYRHDPEGNDPDMMNPVNEFDLWSLGPDGKGGPDRGSKEERADDIGNW